MEIKIKKKKLRPAQIGFYIALIAYPLIQWGVFWFYVNFQTITLTFQEYTGEGLRFVGFANYVRLIPEVFFGQATDPTMFNAFLNSYHSILINLIILPIALVASYAFYKKVPCEKYFRIMFYMPNMVSMVVLVMCFRFLFFNYPETYFVGPLASVFNSIGLNVDWFDVVEKSNVIWPLIYAYCIWSGFGVNVIMICGNMQRIPADITDYCKIDGLGFWREFWSIVLPLIMPTITVFVLNIIMGVFGFTYAPMFIAQSHGTNGQVYTLGWYIFDQVAAGNTSSLINATTVGISWSVFMLPIILFAKWGLDKLTPEVYF